ncbi:MAG: DUF106 domain-containing protein [Haloferacaceae archaeon]
MPGEQLETLLDNPAMCEAISIVFERSRGGAEELQWVDVKDALSGRQWGRLIREGVLVEGGAGFTLAHPDRVERTLADGGRLRDGEATADGTGEATTDGTEEATADGTGEATTDGTEEGEDSGIDDPSWTSYDKVAGLATLVLFVGYWNAGVRDVIASLDDVVLAPLTHALPFYAVVLLLSIATGLYSTVLQDRLMDAEMLGQYQERMDDLKDRKAEAKERGDEEAVERIQEEQMEAASKQMGMFKLQFRPMVWIMLLTIPVFLWLRWKVRGGHLAVGETGMIVPLAGTVSWQQSLLGPMPTWLVWYFVCSMAARQVVQKILDVQTSPTAS